MERATLEVEIMSASRARRSALFVSLIFAAVLQAATPKAPVSTASGALPGMPPVLNSNNIYSADSPGDLSPVVKNFPSRVYVPNTVSNTVTVIDPKTYQVIDTFRVGRLPQHVTPSYDLKTLWVLNDRGNSPTRIDPATGKLKET